MSIRRLTPLALLALAACATAPDGQSAQDVIDFSQDADLELAEQLATDALFAKAERMEGIDAVVTTRVRVDDRGFAHTRVQQTLDGLPVFGAEAIVHLHADGSLFTITDDLVRGIELDTANALPVELAVSAAIDASGRPESKLDAEPDTQLVVFRDTLGADHLAWKVILVDEESHGQSKHPMRDVFMVDAHTGELITHWTMLDTAALQDSDQTVYDNNNSTRFNKSAVGDSSDAELQMTYDAVASTLDFLLTEHGRDSYDGAGKVVKSYGHYGRNYVNAYWDGTRLVFGDGDGSTSSYLGVLDVTAHELGHAMTENEANLVYSNESGALNEAASDILAASVEAYVDGGVSQDTWDIGEDCWLASSALRYMASPSDDGSSRDHYSDRYTGTQDYGGVHWNSGIANHWFYLLSAGGTHHDSAYATTSVTGIGISDAYSIWYEALSNYMTSSTDYAGARTATESACSALGYATTTCDSVSAAWAEVGVGAGDGGGGGGTETGDSTPTGGGTCPAGTTELTGSLSTGASDSYSYSSSTSGTHSGLLYGPSGSDFDLYLGKKKGKNYRTVASGTTSSTNESVSYSGDGGSYVWQVTAYAGSGAYTLCVDVPN
jgi:Zn-dependent metalloprotease